MVVSADSTPQMPSCAAKCLVETIPQSNCSLTDTACICSNKELQDNVSSCVLQNCSVRESLTTKNITATQCHQPVRNKGNFVSVTAYALGALSLLAYGLRIASRFSQSLNSFGWDDLFITLAVAADIPLIVIAPLSVHAGLGRDTWAVPFQDITHMLYLYGWDEVIYFFIIPTTKISILCFYLRIFPQRPFRTAVFIVIGLNVGYFVTFFFTTIFQCRPVHGAWTRWDDSFHGHCSAVNAQGWVTAALNLALDIATLGLPLRPLAKLSLSLRRKLMVMFMFSLGFFVTIISILRLKSLVALANTQNPTWDYVWIAFWTCLEIEVGIICACLPAIRSLLIRMMPDLFRSSLSGSSKTPQIYYSSNPRGPGNTRRTSYTQHGRTGSRLDGMMSQRPKVDSSSDFIPLVDLENVRTGEFSRT